MSEYFENALHHFVKDFNYSGAIVHLAEKGFTISQIRERIGGNLSDDFLSEQMRKAYADSGYLLLQEPGMEVREKISMVKETGPYGRVSYRQVRETIEVPGLPLVSKIYEPGTGDDLLHFLWKKAQKDEKTSYISMKITPKKLMEWEEILDQDQIDFLKCFLPLHTVFYLKIEHRTLSIVNILYEKGLYEGTAYYLNSGQRWLINQKNI